MTDRQTPEDGSLLVFGDDGSPPADVAWLWINNHLWPGWSIEAVTARLPSYPMADGSGPPELEEWSPPWDRAATRPEGLASLRSLTGVGDPRLLLGDRVDAELIVVGPRGYGHARAVWSGSTTEWLLHHPPAPLAVIRSAAPVRETVVCTDGSPHATAALDAFARLPLATGAAVTVLAVDDGRAGAGEAAEAAVARLGKSGVTAQPREVAGKPTQAIMEHLDEHRPQLVVLGTRGLTGFTRLRLGSTAAAVARAGNCSSLVACHDPEPAST